MKTPVFIQQLMSPSTQVKVDSAEFISLKDKAMKLDSLLSVVKKDPRFGYRELVHMVGEDIYGQDKKELYERFGHKINVTDKSERGMQIVQARARYNINAEHHFRYKDNSGKTLGCGCLVCKLRYLITNYGLEIERLETINNSLQFLQNLSHSIPNTKYMGILKSRRVKIKELYLEDNVPISSGGIVSSVDDSRILKSISLLKTKYNIYVDKYRKLTLLMHL